MRWQRDIVRRRQAARSKRRRTGRPATRRNIRALVRRLARENPESRCRQILTPSCPAFVKFYVLLYPHSGFSRASRRTSARMLRRVAGRSCGAWIWRPGGGGRCRAASARSWSGVTSSPKTCPSRAFGIRPSRAASRARSAQLQLQAAAAGSCRTATWWRRIRISAVFHLSSRRDSRSHAATLVIRRKTNRRHMIGDHHDRTAGRQPCWSGPWTTFSARTGPHPSCGGARRTRSPGQTADETGASPGHVGTDHPDEM